MAHSRLQFLQRALRFGAIGSMAPTLMMDARLAERALAAGARDHGKNIMVVVQLAGGNDGLNTIIPYGDGRYYQDRPTLGIPQRQVLHIDNHLGFHPSLTGLKTLYDRGQVAVVQGVGYPSPNLSHFRSTDIWQSAQPIGALDSGWLGRFLDSAMAEVRNPLKALSLGPLLPKAFWAARTQVPAVQSIESFRFLAGLPAEAEARRLIGAFQQIYGVANATEGPYLSLVQLGEASAYQATIQLARVTNTTPPGVQYPDTGLAGQLKLVSQIIATNLGTRVFMVTQGGYDDHADEASAHPQLLAELGNAVAAFYADLAAQGRASQVLLMTFSEFGRRPQENGSHGTDHGTAAPMLVVGGAVKGGVYGQTPSLTDLDNGNLRFSTDFRSVYSTVLASWMGADPTAAVLGTFPTIPFV
ncbi:MAG TPA: DUF1501 domain-containing protein [Chloroflexota bacterium]|nr:DUF1501 domain-containing protein [Chloroflexota bacterium]